MKYLRLYEADGNTGISYVTRVEFNKKASDFKSEEFSNNEIYEIKRNTGFYSEDTKLMPKSVLREGYIRDIIIFYTVRYSPGLVSDDVIFKKLEDEWFLIEIRPSNNSTNFSRYVIADGFKSALEFLKNIK